jgi:hypothetical protein
MRAMFAIPCRAFQGARWRGSAGNAEIFLGMTVFLMLLRNANWKTASHRVGLAIVNNKSFGFLVLRNPSGTC